MSLPAVVYVHVAVEPEDEGEPFVPHGALADAPDAPPKITPPTASTDANPADRRRTRTTNTLLRSKTRRSPAPRTRPPYPNPDDVKRHQNRIDLAAIMPTVHWCEPPTHSRRTTAEHTRRRELTERTTSTSRGTSFERATRRAEPETEGREPADVSLSAPLDTTPRQAAARLSPSANWRAGPQTTPAGQQAARPDIAEHAAGEVPPTVQHSPPDASHVLDDASEPDVPDQLRPEARQHRRRTPPFRQRPGRMHSTASRSAAIAAAHFTFQYTT